MCSFLVSGAHTVFSVPELNPSCTGYHASRPSTSALQALPYSLPYCTPPYSPSSTGSTGEEPSSGLCSASVLPTGTAPTAGFVGQTAVKTEAPSSSEACARTEWMSTLLMPPALTHEMPLDPGQLSVVYMCYVLWCVLHVESVRIVANF